ncbi:hypothetical protein Lal_00018272 [Lupinus albus]|uniref:Putative carboxylic ester hydrolase n=1 Tax=Lupinus albus TaxID=3870 RepID=A0A6A4NFV2_LUPAL|nr:putative carboxylic ester hydrolase [Lupinus albus]KAF1866886.1 hypothetical protein Lal_00018272 [Lupinus albus]
MAKSIPITLIPFPKTHQSSFKSNHPKFQAPPPFISKTITTNTKSIFTCNSNSCLSSTINDLEAPQQKQSYKPDIANVWRKIHGQDNWVGLLDPMNPVLRTELIRYGEMTQACYDAFDYDPYSKYCGGSRYSLQEFFESLNMTYLGYTATRFLYTTANVNLPKFFKKSRWPDKLWSPHANWAGYIAVSDDVTTKALGRRDIIISWRGTVTNVEWVADLTNILKPLSKDIPNCTDEKIKIEAGFLDLYTDREKVCGYCKYSARQQVLGEVKRLVEKYPNDELSITITGHSLGSALAILNAYDIAETKLNVAKNGKKIHVSVFSYSGPRVGNLRFKNRLENELGVKVLRVHNTHDLVPKSPGLILNETMPSWFLNLAQDFPWCYTHVGEELELDHKKSPHLNPNGDSACAHNLEAHLHLIDGFHGKNDEFKLTTGRDLALVNKGSDFLVDALAVPPSWRQELNKNMALTEEGRWVQAERTKLEDHPEDIDFHLKQLGLAAP